MPHGTPDWGFVGPKDIVYGLDDLGEHAVRLGSPHLWDRRGDVLYTTDFREGLGAFHYQSWGTGAGVALVTGSSRAGAYCIRLRAGSDGEQRALLHLALPFQDPSCVGLEFSFAVASKTSTVEAQIGWHDGTWHYRGAADYDHVNSRLDYRDQAGAWAVLQTGVARHECIRAEHTMKLVVDMSLNEYVRFLIDEQAYDMRGISVWREASVMLPYWWFRLSHYSQAGHNPDTYIDNVIITQNEPR